MQPNGLSIKDYQDKGNACPTANQWDRLWSICYCLCPILTEGKGIPYHGGLSRPESRSAQMHSQERNGELQKLSLMRTKMQRKGNRR